MKTFIALALALAFPSIALAQGAPARIPTGYQVPGCPWYTYDAQTKKNERECMRGEDGTLTVVRKRIIHEQVFGNGASGNQAKEKD